MVKSAKDNVYMTRNDIYSLYLMVHIGLRIQICGHQMPVFGYGF